MSGLYVHHHGIALLIPSPIPELNWNWLYPVQAELELNWNCHHWNWSRNCVLRNWIRNCLHGIEIRYEVPHISVAYYSRRLAQVIYSLLVHIDSTKEIRGQGWIPRRVVSAYDVVNASYLPTTINIYDLEIRSINNYRKSYDIASFLVSTKIYRRCRFGNSKPCKYIRSSYVRRNCIYGNNRVSANISSYDYRWFLS